MFIHLGGETERKQDVNVQKAIEISKTWTSSLQTIHLSEYIMSEISSSLRLSLELGKEVLQFYDTFFTEESNYEINLPIKYHQIIKPYIEYLKKNISENNEYIELTLQSPKKPLNRSNSVGSEVLIHSSESKLDIIKTSAITVSQIELNGELSGDLNGEQKIKFPISIFQSSSEHILSLLLTNSFRRFMNSKK